MSDKKAQSCLKSEMALHRQFTTTSDESKKLVWTKCSEADARKRLSIKEQSLDIGLKYCEQLINTIECRFANITKHNKQSAEKIWPLEDRNEWIAQCRSIIRDHQEFRVLVGVAGDTGSGKTSVLNALLGFQELLPTNNEEAATAVQCKVRFNHDTRPEYAFRCHVTFQSKEAWETKLRQFLDDLELRNKLEESHNGSIEDDEALHDHERRLQPTREMIKIVFDLHDDDQIEKLGLNGMLRSNSEVLKLLGTANEFNGSTADEISQGVKPYMDSTAGGNSTCGPRFALWPLIEEVELFIKSDILRNGVALVDLPGLGDALRSRVLVAERAFDQLTATLIVSRATRAADNSTAVSLMSKHQEMAMMLDGKFNKQTFCVCLSQIDQIDRKAALSKPDAIANTNLQDLLVQEEKLRLKVNQQEQRLRKLSKAKRRYQRNHATQVELDPAKMDRMTISKAKAKAKRWAVKFANISKESIESKRRLVELDSEITFTCIRARNRLLKERIKRDFQKRQARLVPKALDIQKTYDGQVSVCPTSSTAFWKCKGPIERMVGFPTESYTGIPSLASWIRNATIRKREEHVDDLLNRLQAQYNIILLWAKDKGKLKDTPVTKDSFEEHILADLLRTMEQSLAAYCPLLTAEVYKKNPLNGKEELILSTCPEMCIKTVRGWAYKKPDDRASDKVHWTTYGANLRRSGGKFVSKSKETRHEYNWMEDISHILFTQIVTDWNQFLNHDIPSLADKVWPVMDKIWDEFITNLNTSVQNAEPRLIPELANEKFSLEIIKINAKNKVRQALGRISDDATQFYPDAVARIQSNWEQTFKEALGIEGSQAHTLRQQHLLDFARKYSKRIYRTVYKGLQQQLRKIFDKLPEELKSISDSTIKDLRRYLGVFLDKVLEPTDLAVKSAAVAEEKARLQRSVITELMEWTSEWQFPISGNDANDNNTDEIPEEYQHAQTDLGQLEDDDNSLDSESDLDSDLDSDNDNNGIATDKPLGDEADEEKGMKN
ncbi:hypothetical protein F4823DRAFT_632609 [Ustulina deusta]|nr:hypothetical protein F4823DRAFT_632609 [Ustulina deusta]